jgi:hypothetical protein
MMKSLDTRCNFFLIKRPFHDKIERLIKLQIIYIYITFILKFFFKMSSIFNVEPLINDEQQFITPLGYVELFIGTDDEYERHLISSLSMTSNAHTGPTVGFEFGRHVLNVPQVGIYNYQLPPIDSSDFKNFLRCNAFMMYRRCVQKALPGSKSSLCSIIAKESWKLASKDLKEFFKKYTRDVFIKKEKVYRIIVNKRRPRNQ